MERTAAVSSATAVMLMFTGRVVFYGDCADFHSVQISENRVGTDFDAQYGPCMCYPKPPLRSRCLRCAKNDVTST